MVATTRGWVKRENECLFPTLPFSLFCNIFYWQFYNTFNIGCLGEAKPLKPGLNSKIEEIKKHFLLYFLIESNMKKICNGLFFSSNFLN